MKCLQSKSQNQKMKKKHGNGWGVSKQGDLKVETEAALCASHGQTIRTNYVKHKIDKKA